MPYKRAPRTADRRLKALCRPGQGADFGGNHQRTDRKIMKEELRLWFLVQSIFYAFFCLLQLSSTIYYQIK